MAPVEALNQLRVDPAGHAAAYQVPPAQVPTLAVSIVSHLDLQARQTSISVQLAVVPVGLAVAATH